METIILIVVFSLAWGSFLNVVIYRLPHKMSLLRPRSFCPQCRKTIPFYLNIPVFSYILLGGKCRYCKKRIPLTYFLVEVLTPASFVLVHLRTGMGIHFLAGCLFTSALIVLMFVDYYHQLLPDIVTLPLLVLALVYSFFRPELPFPQSLLGAAVGGGFLFLVYGGYYLIRKKEGLGLGDVTMMVMVGAFLGWRLTLLTLILASFVGAIVGVIIILARKKNLQHALPFGTFLAPAAYVAFIWGEKIISAYMTLYRQ